MAPAKSRNIRVWRGNPATNDKISFTFGGEGQGMIMLPLSPKMTVVMSPTLFHVLGLLLLGCRLFKVVTRLNITYNVLASCVAQQVGAGDLGRPLPRKIPQH